VADRTESLAILTAMARDGKVTAAIALARELSGQEVENERRGDERTLLDEILEGVAGA
jgi:hypothetical protein